MNKIKFTNMPELPYALEEAVNRLRVNVGFLGTDIRRIMVISSDQNEGKSFVAMQLWRQMAEAGTPSLLLDVDLRKSVIRDHYGISSEDGGEIRGMSHYLAGDYPVKEAILHTDIEGGDILPNTDNVINPSMLVGNERFKEMLAYAKENYRYTFLDAPPLGLVSDGEKIASMCDGAILVIRGGVTSRRMVQSAMNQLDRTGCPLLGVVLNRVDTGRKGYYYRKYGSSYYGSSYYSSEYYTDKK